MRPQRLLRSLQQTASGHALRIRRSYNAPVSCILGYPQCMSQATLHVCRDPLPAACASVPKRGPGRGRSH